MHSSDRLSLSLIKLSLILISVVSFHSNLFILAIDVSLSLHQHAFDIHQLLKDILLLLLGLLEVSAQSVDPLHVQLLLTSLNRADGILSLLF